jgi:molecular chaperone HscB
MNKKMGEDDPALLEELRAHKAEFEKKFEGLDEELRSYWSEWDALPDAAAEDDRRVVRDKMVDLLNRRSYIRNLVRDVEELVGDL